MVFYDLDVSGNCYKIRLFATLTNTKLDLVSVDLASGQHHDPNFRKLNSFGEVPVLEGGDVTLRDSQPTLVYLADQPTDRRWWPEDTRSQALVTQWLVVALNCLGIMSPKLLTSALNWHLLAERGMAGRYALRTTLTVMAFTGIIISAAATAFSRDLPSVAECISAATVLPLLGGVGDSPLVEAKFDGMRGALFVSPQYGKFLVRNVSDDFWFADDGSVTAIGIDRQREPAELTHVGRLQFGTLELHDLRALIVDRAFPVRAGIPPIVGIIGREFLSEYGLIELIDIPHRKLAFYRWDHDRCGSSTRLLGADAHIADLREDDSVDGVIAGKKVRIHFDPDLGRDMLPLNEAKKLGFTTRALKMRPQVMLDFVGKNHGYLSKKVTVSVADVNLPYQDFLITENIERISLGYQFFRNRTVMFDFKHRTFGALDVTDPEPLPPAQHLHFDSYSITNVGVSENAGTLQGSDQK
ncbi:glutathione S-transferase N-terminal domain-containing protein [Gluconacetobacter asukensis]|uniref:GST N-terminal domain-containing protein n=1 Tax=Gluconacetobacter asukensis TaxID=1017181 RepID=A0A7W4J0D6_9PROT|nr:glutathione S-transferase N-terminal domain-containing protein [Gluconacetobacter asukensis]MBB2172345.1 hypothetical protein [Gluconacetobacter asukensis]